MRSSSSNRSLGNSISALSISSIRSTGRFGDFLGQHGFAGAGLALDQQRSLEHDRGVDGDLQVVGGDVVFGAGKLHRVFALLLFLRAGASEQETTAGSAVVVKKPCWFNSS